MINKVEKHETDEECNVCGKEQVISQYGNRSCDNYNCAASTHGNEIHWNSTDEEIEEWERDRRESRTNDYEVRRINDDDRPIIIAQVTAASFEIQDGGVLVFKEVRDDAPTIGDVAGDRKKLAFKNWGEVERV